MISLWRRSHWNIASSMSSLFPSSFSLPLFSALLRRAESWLSASSASWTACPAGVLTFQSNVSAWATTSESVRMTE